MGCAAPSGMGTLMLVLALMIGCVDQGGGVIAPNPADPSKPVPVVALTSEREFLLALARGIERGDFDDTDKLQVGYRRAAKNLGIDGEKIAKPLSDALGDLGVNRSLTDANVRNAMASKLKAAAGGLK